MSKCSHRNCSVDWVASAVLTAVYAGDVVPVKQEPPEMAVSEGSTDRKTLLEVPGGCSPDCA